MKNFHDYGSDKNYHFQGLKHLLGDETFDWHFVLTPTVVDDVDRSLEKNEPPFGFRIYVLKPAYNRLWEDDKTCKPGRHPNDYGWLVREKRNEAIGLEPKQVQKDKDDLFFAINDELTSDKYKLDFEYPFCSITGTPEPDLFRCPRERFVERVDFVGRVKEAIDDIIKNARFQLLPQFAIDFVKDNTKIIDFMRERANSVRLYINGKIATAKSENNEDEINKYLALKWAFHPIFEESGEGYETNFFIKIPQFFSKAFVGWDFIFLNGKVVFEPEHLEEVGNRLDREMQTFMAQRTHGHVHKVFSPQSEELFRALRPYNMCNGEQWARAKEVYLNKFIRYYWYQIFTRAISLGTPFFHLPQKDNDDYTFSCSPDSKAALETDDHRKKIRTTIREQRASLSFHGSREIPNVIETIQEYCEKMVNLSWFFGSDKNHGGAAGSAASLTQPAHLTVNLKSIADLVGSSPKIQSLREKLIPKAAKSKTGLLLYGKAGTGKGWIAEAVHLVSLETGYRTGKFVSFDCEEAIGKKNEDIEENLARKLYGSESRDTHGELSIHPGAFENARGGTLLLYNIGFIPKPFQKELLTVLEHGSLTRVGGHEQIAIDVRIITAISTSLEEFENDAQHGRFRHDLYRYLSLYDKWEVPSLRDRKEDIPALVHFLAARHCENKKKTCTYIPDNVMGILQQHKWTFNIRELSDTVARLVDECEGDSVQVNDLPQTILDAIVSESATGTQNQKSESTRPKQQKTKGSGRKNVYDKRLPALFEDLEGKVYSKTDPLCQATAYRYTKEDIAKILKRDYPNEFTGAIGSVAKTIQTHPLWRKWKETREKFIGKNCSLNQSALRVEKFERVVHDYLSHILGLKNRTRETKHDAMLVKECDGLNDEEYRELANKITTKSAAQWAQKHEADYVEIGEIFRWKIESLAAEFAKTSEWRNRSETLGVTTQACRGVK